jgi:hypothetical protein
MLATEGSGCAPTTTSRDAIIINCGRIGFELERIEATMSPFRIRSAWIIEVKLRDLDLYITGIKGVIRRIPRLPRVSSGGGGDEGEFTENSTHPKLPENSGSLVLPKRNTMKKGIKIGEVMQGIQPP